MTPEDTQRLQQASEHIKHLSALLFPTPSHAKRSDMPHVDFHSIEHLLQRNLLDLPAMLNQSTSLTRTECGIASNMPIHVENVDPKNKKSTGVQSQLHQFLVRLQTENKRLAQEELIKQQ